MLAYIEGTITLLEAESVVVDVHGVGYRIFTARQRQEVGERQRFYVTEVIREDRHDLYGFPSQDELAMFEALTGVQGVGPKVGMKIMSAGSPDDVRRRILAGDLAFFTGISGVGKKTAQKIILDLKGVLVDDGGVAPGDEAADALLSLGYSKEDIAAVTPHLKESDLSARIKEALKMLGRR